MTVRVKHYNNLDELLRAARQLGAEVQDTLARLRRFQKLMSLASTSLAARAPEEMVREVILAAKGKVPTLPQPKHLPAGLKIKSSEKKSPQLPTKPAPAPIKTPAPQPSSSSNVTIRQVVKHNEGVKRDGSEQDTGQPHPTADEFFLLRDKVGLSFSAFSDLRNQRIALINMLTQMKTDFAADSRAATVTGHLTAMLGRIDRELVAARKVMHDLAQERMPLTLKRVSNRIEKKLLELLSGKFGKNKRETMVSPVGDEIHYVIYLHLTDFANEHDVVSPDYYVVLTLRVLENGTSSLHLTTLYSHQMPGLYPPGPTIPVGPESVKMAERVLEEKLHVDKFDDILKPMGLPVGGDQFGAIKLPFVSSITMHPSKRYVLVVRMPRKAVKKDDIALRKSEVLRALRSVVTRVHPRFDDKIRVSPTTQDGEHWKFEAFFSPNDQFAHRKSIDAFDYDRLADMFDMKPADIQRLRVALERIPS